jgi:hypothetical protein
MAIREVAMTYTPAAVERAMKVAEVLLQALARHGVGCHAVPPTIECAMPIGKIIRAPLPGTASTSP